MIKIIQKKKKNEVSGKGPVRLFTARINHSGFFLEIANAC